MIPSARRVVRSHLGAVTALVLVSVGLVAADRFLATTETSELAREARDEFAAGMRSMSAGDAVTAAKRFGRAHMLARTNREYQLALGEAYAASGQFDRAQREIEDVLDRDSNGGAANLAMARLSARMGRQDEADAYYHRAVYGTWRQDADARRRAARLELAEYLAAHGRREELLSEAVVLQTEAASDPAMAARVAEFFLKAGSAGRAVTAYTELVKAHPDDINAQRGLAGAQMAAGDFRHAQIAWLRIVQRNPGDRDAAAGLRFAASLEQMDPTARRLRAAEKLRRARTLLAAVRADVERCSGAVASDVPERKDDDAETVISSAEQLWDTRPAGCTAAADDPVPVLMSKIRE